MKYKHTEDTNIVVEDLINRVQQLVEASELSGENGFVGAQYEAQAFKAVLTILNQVKTTGHVFRGSDYVPDGLLPYVKTPSFHNPLKVVKEEL